MRDFSVSSQQPPQKAILPTYLNSTYEHPNHPQIIKQLRLENSQNSQSIYIPTQSHLPPNKPPESSHPP